MASEQETEPKAPSEPSERLERAKKLREEGNAKFKAEDLSGARKAYNEALGLTAALPEGLKEEAASLRQPVQLNLALACLRLDQPCRALELCEEVLDTDPDNPKATYRKAKALLELGEDKEAEYELVRACKLMPKDAVVRKDLEALRQKLRAEKAQEQATFQGLFEKSPGFASEGRKEDPSRLSKRDLDDIYFHDGKENPYETAERPQDLVPEFLSSGRLEDAAQALEAAMGQSAQEENWLAHLTYALEYGALLMDLNIDRLALRCFNTALERPAKDEEEEVALAPVRQHALLLKAICLLNEAADAQAEITECLEKWVVAAHGGSDLELKERLLQLQEQSADAAVAVGLLYLLEAKAEVVPCFAGALLAEQGYFGQRPSTRWNMLGAVLSMTGKPELAVRAYRQALQCQPHYPRALINMSASQLKCGGFLEACSSQAQALKVLPFWAAEETWTSLEKEVMAQSTVDDLAEAVKGRHIAKARELLEPYAQDLQNSDLPSEPRQALKEMELIK